MRLDFLKQNKQGVSKMELKKIAVGLTALLGMSVANAHNVWL